MVTLNYEQANCLKSILNAIKYNFKHYNGMNTGSSTVHNIYPNDLRIMDDILNNIENNVK